MQGLRAWLALRSQRGQPAGAVQVAVYLTSLDGCAWPSTRAGWCAHTRVWQLVNDKMVALMVSGLMCALADRLLLCSACCPPLTPQWPLLMLARAKLQSHMTLVLGLM